MMNHLAWPFPGVWQLFFILCMNVQEPKASKERKTTNPEISVLTACQWHQELVKEDEQPGQLAQTLKKNQKKPQQYYPLTLIC